MTVVAQADRLEVAGAPATSPSPARPRLVGAVRRAVPTRAGVTRVLLPVVGLAAVVGLWEALTRLGILPLSQVPRPADTGAELVELLASSDFRAVLALTLRTWAVGLAIAIALALPLGVLLGLSDRAYRFVRLPLEAIRPVPPIVILPLALLALGGSIAFQATLIVQGALWPLLVTVTYGVREVDVTTLDTARSYRLSPVRTLLCVRLPAAAPLIASGLRLAAATAFAITLVTELVGGARGIGTVLMIGQSGGDVARVYAVTLLAGLVGLVIAAAFGLVERRALGWQEGGR